MSIAVERPTIGTLLRSWRERRRLSQLELSLESAISARHLSFVETGRARPSREMVVHLAERLDVPLRERNDLLLAAGFAPLYGERSLDDEEMAPVRDALDRFLAAHEPYPAVVVDRALNIVAANSALDVLTEGSSPQLLAAPANGLRLTLHPDGMAPRIVNLDQWSSHLLARLRRRVAITGDAGLQELYDEIARYPGVVEETQAAEDPVNDVVLPLRLRHGEHELSFICTLSTFGTAVDVTLSELSVEAFYPADEITGAVLRRVSAREVRPRR